MKTNNFLRTIRASSSLCYKTASLLNTIYHIVNGVPQPIGKGKSVIPHLIRKSVYKKFLGKGR